MQMDPLKQEARSQYSLGRTVYQVMMPLQLFIAAFERGAHWSRTLKEVKPPATPINPTPNPIVSLARLADVPEMSIWLEKLFIWADAYYWENQKAEVDHVFEDKTDKTHFENIEARLRECLDEIKDLRDKAAGRTSPGAGS